MSNFFFSLPSFFPFNACNKEDNSSLFTLAKIAKLSKKIDSYLCCFFYSTAAISLFFPAFTAVAVISGVALIVLTVACEIFEQRKNVIDGKEKENYSDIFLEEVLENY